jgi:hypothetical protein
MNPIYWKKKFIVFIRILLGLSLVIPFMMTSMPASAQTRFIPSNQINNLPLTVNAGLDQVITLADAAFLNGHINDDGLLNQTFWLSTDWKEMFYTLAHFVVLAKVYLSLGEYDEAMKRPDICSDSIMNVISRPREQMAKAERSGE